MHQAAVPIPWQLLFLGCAHGEDSVQHYQRCKVLHTFAAGGLRLPMRPGVAEQSVAFMLLEPAAGVTDETLTRRALLMAAAYRLHCGHRRRREALGSPLEVPRALEQAVKEAARGHRRATACLDQRWVTSPARGRRRAVSR